MFVGDRMSKPVITVAPDLPIQDALHLMQKEKIRRLPVVDKNGKLRGIVSERDLLHASPSDVTSLSVWEINYLLSRITIKQIMTKDVVSVTEDTPIEEAARIMADNKIGGLPVVRDSEVAGIITETDLFKLFLELLGAREAGVRASALVPDKPGELAKIATAIAQAGGNIIALGTFLGETTKTSEIVVKTDGLGVDQVKDLLDPLVERLDDVRETKPA